MPSTTDAVRYQVFVSSTFTDLKEEREKVLQAILECQAFPSGMELFPSANDEQFEFIKREIDSSDYYVLIVAGRYGSVASDGTSFTEKEFDYAVSQKKPILAFLCEDLQSLPLSRSEPDPGMRAKLSAFRDKATKSRLVKFYENPDHLKGQVLQTLNYQFRVNPRRGWVPAGELKREDLEEIRKLQQRVIRLEDENAELRKLQQSVKEQLSQGQDVVKWTVNGAKIKVVAYFLDPATQTKNSELISVAEGDVSFESTWDDLLDALFPGATSRILTEDVEERLLRSLVHTVPKGSLHPLLANDSVIDKLQGSDLAPMEKVRTDVYRQFTGLGLVEEITETDYQTRYEYTGSAASTYTHEVYQPYLRTAWRLTREGMSHLALVRGYKRSGEGYGNS